MKKILKLIIIIVIIGTLIYTLKDNQENTKKTTKYEKYTTTKSETNKKLVEEYIADGIDLEDLKKILNKEEKYIKEKGKYKEIKYNFEKHYKYKELEKIYKTLSLSEIVKVENIGKSYDNRNIYSLEIGKGKKQIMLEGNIHAAEIAPALYLTKLAVDLVNDWESKDKEIIKLLNDYKFIIVPTINPDGYDYSIFGKEVINNQKSYVYENDSDIENEYFKANINGVDLNRNMPSQLSGLYLTGQKLYYTVSRKKSTERLRYFAGENVGSEPETQALIYWMIKNYKGTHAYLSIHSAGRVIYNGKPHLSDKFNENSKECANVLSEYTDYLVLGLDSEIDGDGTDGTSTDLIAEIAHGYKFSTKTRRLSTSKYDIQAKNIEQNMCVLTVETLEKYTQDLNTIKAEWNNKNLKEGIIEIAKLNLE